MKRNYEELFAAVYELAVKDDFGTVRAEILRRLRNMNITDRDAREYIEISRDYIKRQVQENIYKETFIWGDGTSRKIQKENINALAQEMVETYEQREDKLLKKV